MTTSASKGDDPHKVRAIPEGYGSVTPWILSKDTAKLLDFLKAAFGADELARMHDQDGSIVHAETRIGDSVVMLFDVPGDVPPTPCFLRLFVEDADSVYQQALAAGATSVTEVTELAFGDRVGRVRDPLGNIWWIQTHVVDVTLEEMERRNASQIYIDAMQYVKESLARELRRMGT